MKDDKPGHFDKATAGAIMDEVEVHYRDRLDRDDNLGAQARMNKAVLRPAIMAVIDEHNRGTAADDIYDGVAAVIANILISTANNEHPVINEIVSRVINNLAWAATQPEDPRVMRHLGDSEEGSA